MSAPACSSAWICSTVPLMSCVTVFVIDCTVIGASPPTGTLPTWIWRQGRRGISRYGRTLILNLAGNARSDIERFGDGKKTAPRVIGIAAGRQNLNCRPAGQRRGIERDIAAQCAERPNRGHLLAVYRNRQRAGVAGAQDQAGARRHAIGLAGLQHAREDD